MRVVQSDHLKDIRSLMGELGVDPYGIGIMAPKALTFSVRINALSPILANILKQEMLSLGGDVALARDVLTGKVPVSDCLLIGSLSQFHRLEEKLKKQPFGLSDLARGLSQTLANYQKEHFSVELGPYRLRLGARARIQRFGRFLSGMVMPNMGAFIAWGLITTFFIPTGWIPNEKLAALVGPMIVYMLPVLIAYTGGKLVWGVRGGVVGVIAAMGVIIGADIPMFLGAMLMGPLGGWVIKKWDEVIEPHIPVGFEMLVNNFSAGIIGGALSLLGLLLVSPVVMGVSNTLMGGVDWIVSKGLLPLASILVEPGKILFLNNAINHGVFGPLGVQQVQEAGKSVLFLIETNPGPGMGILLAYFFFSKGAVKETTPASMVIHFLGGIHEIYFPYVLMNPILILAVMAGG
ncbi:MAG: PTS transporter subunit EIIC, partial [Candidatus Omnitrophica bacterium]|nr:PTS transporter subunit EIIC [Candidatus Omnitrophota bacterium]